ncbi:HAD hydrolase-like protein [Maricaulaceae bacterium EIL42A08]|nr:HAD hydrolase-like protein [Maricaulaceae bacterium EIL42A08]
MAFQNLSGARIAFDLDGTLVDTAPDLVRALNAAIMPAGLSEVPLDAVRPMVGRGARALILRAYEREGLAQPDEETTDAKLDVFLKVYADGIADLSRPFEGVEASLDQLAEGGAELSICTNKPGWLARPLMEELNLADRFVRITGADDVPEKKPSALHLETAIGGKADSRTVMVGDSDPDVGTARAAGAPVVLFSEGYSEKPASTLGADRLFSHWHQAPELIAGLVT